MKASNICPLDHITDPRPIKKELSRIEELKVNNTAFNTLLCYVARTQLSHSSHLFDLFVGYARSRGSATEWLRVDPIMLVSNAFSYTADCASDFVMDRDPESIRDPVAEVITSLLKLTIELYQSSALCLHSVTKAETHPSLTVGACASFLEKLRVATQTQIWGLQYRFEVNWLDRLKGVTKQKLAIQAKHEVESLFLDAIAEYGTGTFGVHHSNNQTPISTEEWNSFIDLLMHLKSEIWEASNGVVLSDYYVCWDDPLVETMDAPNFNAAVLLPHPIWGNGINTSVHLIE